MPFCLRKFGFLTQLLSVLWHHFPPCSEEFGGKSGGQKGPVMKWIAGPVALRQRLDHLEALSAQSLASSHGGKCSLQTRRRSSTYRLSCVCELISITRVRTRSTRDHRPMFTGGRAAVGPCTPPPATSPWR